MRKLQEGTSVKVLSGRGIPVRYRNRNGVVAGNRVSNKGTLQYAINFPGRRATPLFVSASRLNLAG